MRRVLIGFCLCFAACGGSPTAPARPQTPPLPAASLRINAELEPKLTASADGWRYAGEGRNTGEGCAARVKGSVTFKDVAGTTLQTSTFQMPEDRVITPGAAFAFDGCCMSAETHGKIDGGALLASFTWDNVRC